jgi:hypothetical protein
VNDRHRRVANVAVVRTIQRGYRGEDRAQNVLGKTSDERRVHRVDIALAIIILVQQIAKIAALGVTVHEGVIGAFTGQMYPNRMRVVAAELRIDNEAVFGLFAEAQARGVKVHHAHALNAHQPRQPFQIDPDVESADVDVIQLQLPCILSVEPRLCSVSGVAVV